MRLLIARWMRSLQGKRHLLKKLYALLLLPTSVVLIFTIGCGPLRTVAHAPATSISISFTIQDQYTSAPKVTLQATFADSEGLFALSGNQNLACNGVIFPQVRYAYAGIQLKRQPPGGAYHCIYTDDQGKTTPVLVPVPSGVLAITSPTTEASVPIPGSAPLSTPEASPTPGTRSPESTSSMTIQYTVPAIPASARVVFQASVACGSVASPHACGAVYGDCRFGPGNPSGGSCAISDAGLVYGYGFEIFSPGPGSINLTSDMQWYAPVVSFQELHIDYRDNLSMPIIWVRS